MSLALADEFRSRKLGAILESLLSLYMQNNEQTQNVYYVEAEIVESAIELNGQVELSSKDFDTKCIRRRCSFYELGWIFDFLDKTKVVMYLGYVGSLV